LSVVALAPEVLKLVRAGIAKHRKVSDGLANKLLVRDIIGELPVDDVVQYLKLRAVVGSVPTGVDADEFRWKWTVDGQYNEVHILRLFTRYHGSP
jgi:hypothetical protein